MAMGADLGRRWEGEGELRNQVRSVMQGAGLSTQIRPRIGEAVGILQKGGEELEEALKGLRGALAPVMEGKEELDKVLPEPLLSTCVPMEGELEYVRRKIEQCLAIVREIQGRLWL